MEKKKIHLRTMSDWAEKQLEERRKWEKVLAKRDSRRREWPERKNQSLALEVIQHILRIEEKMSDFRDEGESAGGNEGIAQGYGTDRCITEGCCTDEGIGEGYGTDGGILEGYETDGGIAEGCGTARGITERRGPDRGGVGGVGDGTDQDYGADSGYCLELFEVGGDTGKWIPLEADQMSVREDIDNNNNSVEDKSVVTHFALDRQSYFREEGMFHRCKVGKDGEAAEKEKKVIAKRLKEENSFLVDLKDEVGVKVWETTSETTSGTTSETTSETKSETELYSEVETGQAAIFINAKARRKKEMITETKAQRDRKTDTRKETEIGKETETVATGENVNKEIELKKKERSGESAFACACAIKGTANVCASRSKAEKRNEDRALDQRVVIQGKKSNEESVFDGKREEEGYSGGKTREECRSVGKTREECRSVGKTREECRSVGKTMKQTYSSKESKRGSFLTEKEEESEKMRPVKERKEKGCLADKSSIKVRKEECCLAGLETKVKGGIRIPNSRQNQIEQMGLVQPPTTKPKLFTHSSSSSSSSVLSSSTSSPYSPSSSLSSFSPSLSLSETKFRREFDDCLKNAISRWKNEWSRIANQKKYSKMEKEMLDQSLLQNSLGEAAIFAAEGGFLFALDAIFDLTDLNPNHEEFYAEADFGHDAIFTLPVYRLYESALNGDEQWIARGDAEITYTPLAAAVSANQLEAAMLLVDRGADGNAPLRPTGKTALHVAVETNADEEVIRFLVDSGCKVNVRDLSGRTPLAATCLPSSPLFYNKKAIEALITAKADVRGLIGRLGSHLLDDQRQIDGKESDIICDFARTILENGGDPNERVSTVGAPSHSSSPYMADGSNRFDSLSSSMVPTLAVAATRLDEIGFDFVRILMNYGVLLPRETIDISNRNKGSRFAGKYATTSVESKTKGKLKLIIVRLLLRKLLHSASMENREQSSMNNNPNSSSSYSSSSSASPPSGSSPSSFKETARRCKRMVGLLYGAETNISWLRDKSNYDYIQTVVSAMSPNNTTDSIILDFIESVLSLEKSPRPLSTIARSVIRQIPQNPTQLEHAVKELQLPKTLKTFLMLR